MKRTPLRKVAPRKTLIKKLEARCEELWKQACRKRDNDRCRYCGATESLQVHHIVSRRHHSTKYDTDNGITLCAGHHKFFAHAACNTPWFIWLENQIGLDAIADLGKRSQHNQHVTYEWLQDVEQQLIKENQ